MEQLKVEEILSYLSEFDLTKLPSDKYTFLKDIKIIK